MSYSSNTDQVSEGSEGVAPLKADYLWIDNAASLAEFVATLPPEGQKIGMDLEADNMHCYQEKLCLLQVSGGGTVGLIDPFAIDDLSPLIDRLFAPGGEIWMHGADFDISLMKAAYGDAPPMIWDTQIAAQLTGSRRFGLAALTEDVIGFKMSKGSQKEDWSQRPLTPKMLDYAALDAHLMFPLSEHFTAKLHDLGRWEWFEESCVAARENVLKRPRRDPDDAWRINGWGKLPKGRAQAYLRSLWAWRDREAERRDRPAFKVVNNRDLLLLAEQLGATDHPSGKALRWRLTKAGVSEFHEVIDEVEKMPESAYPKKPKVQRLAKDDAFDNRVAKLIDHRNKVAEKLDIDSSLIAPRRTIELLALHEKPSDAFNVGEDSGRPLPSMLNWQREVLGI